MNQTTPQGHEMTDLLATEKITRTHMINKCRNKHARLSYACISDSVVLAQLLKTKIMPTPLEN